MSVKSSTRITTGVILKPNATDPADLSPTGTIFYSSTGNVFRGNVTGAFHDFTLTDTVATLTNKTIAASANTLQGVVQTVASLDSQSANASGAAISTTTIAMQSASTGFPGLVNTSAQSFAGAKTFTGAISASNLSGTNTGDVTLASAGSSPNASGASLSGQALTLQPADGSNAGIVSTAAQSFAGAKTFNTSIAVSGSTSGAVTISAASANTSYSMKLPSAQGGANTLLLNDGSGNLSWGSSSPLLVVSAVTGTTSAATSVDLYLCSAAAFTITLPTAVGNTGKIFRIKKTDSSTTNIITIATTSSQTIDGATSLTLRTQYDEITVASDGANWQVVARLITVSAKYTTSNQTVGTAAAVLNCTTKVYDTHSAVSSGVFTVPAGQGGVYLVQGSYGGNAASSTSTNDNISLIVRKNSSNENQVSKYLYQVTGVAFTTFGSGGVTVQCAAGDTLDVTINRSANVASFTLDNTASCMISFTKIGS